jgi:subtilisin family serine protease
MGMSLRSRLMVLSAAVALAGAGLTEGSSLAATPTDPSFSLQWGSSNIGQSIPTQGVGGKEPLGPPANGTPGADDRALSAWGITTGSRSIVIAELDTGVEYTHPDLAANIWANPGGVGGCKAGTHGYNVLDHTCEPTDEDTAYEGHGTHVAGIMGGVANNGIGVAGINWQTSILSVKWLQSAGAETGGLLEALEWVLRVKQEGVNVRVVNDSPTFFGTLRSEAVKKEIELLGANNILFVTAAGNTGNNNDEEAVRRYPCGFHLSNEICVTATDNKDALPSWANYGPKTVDLAAPGVSIYSTLRGEKYGYLTGGSMASPQVAGTAALILATEPSLSATQLKTRILENVRPDPALVGKVTTGGVLDACKVIVDCKEPAAPIVATGPASSVTQTAATLNGSVNPNGEAVGDCHFEYGLTNAYGSSAPCTPAPGSGTSPVAVSASVPTLGPNTTYHFRVVASNPRGTAKGADQAFTTLPNPPAPTVVTSAASSVTQTGATLNGTVNPNGDAVGDCRFEYGLTNAYGSNVPCASAPGSGTSPVAVSAAITGLSANATYHVRVVATSAGGTSRGVDQQFTTLPNPPRAPTVGTSAASSVTQTTATLNGTVNPNGEAVDDCHFDYGVTSAYGSSVPCAPAPGSGTSPVVVSASIGALTQNTTYHFRLIATNIGDTASSVDSTFMTEPLVGALVQQLPPAETNIVLAAQGTSTFVQGSPPPAVVTLAATSLSVSRSGTVGLKIRCQVTAVRCTGTLTLRTLRAEIARLGRGVVTQVRHPQILTLATGAFRLAGGTAQAMRLRLSAAGRRLVARLHTVAARVTIVVRKPDGVTQATGITVLLRGTTQPGARWKATIAHDRLILPRL